MQYFYIKQSTINTEFILRTIETYIRGNASRPACILISPERFGLLCMEQNIKNGKIVIDGVSVIVDELLSFGSTVSLDKSFI
jgi:hypothetical protein